MKKILFIMLGLSILLTGCSSKKIDDVKENIDEKVEQEEKQELEKQGFIVHEYFNTSKFDQNKFSGYLYDDNGKTYNVKDLILKSKDEDISFCNNYAPYHLTKDIEKEESIFHNGNAIFFDDNGLKYVKNVLGDPTAIYEQYSDDKKMSTGDILLVYDYGDYLIEIIIFDYSRWVDYDYKYPGVVGASAIAKSDWLKEEYRVYSKLFYEDYKMYGKDIIK